MRAANPAGVAAFVNELAAGLHIAVSSHLQVLHPLLFLFRHVLGGGRDAAVVAPDAAAAAGTGTWTGR